MFAILALLLLVSTAHAQEGSGVADEGPPVEENRSAQPEQGRGGTSQTGIPVIIVDTPEQATHAAEREQKADEHEAADLDAQVRAANAAERSAATAERQEIPTWAQIVIGFASTIIAVIALAVSVLTAIISIRTSRAELRAYVLPDASRLEITDGGLPVANLRIKNFGQTPAYDVVGWVHMWIEEYPLKIDLPQPGPDFISSKSVVGPGGHFIYRFPRDNPMNTWERGQIDQRKAAIYLYGGIKYRDCFRREQSADFILYFHGPYDANARDNMHNYHDGNRST